MAEGAEERRREKVRKSAFATTRGNWVASVGYAEEELP